MFSYIKVKNFKSLKDVEINFKENKNTVKPIAIIYGENGAGKSNICSAFYFLGESMSTMKTSKILENLLNKISEEEDVPDNIITYLKDRHRDTETIIKDCKTISSKENMVIEYGIEIDGDSGSYIIETNNERIVKEKLKKSKKEYTILNY